MSVELRPVVQAFAEAMEEKLRKNDHRGVWDHTDYEYIWCDINRHLGKMTFSIHIGRDKGKILADAADVANLCMILCDILGVLPVTAIVERREESDER